MELLVLIPLALLGMLIYAVISVTQLRGRVQRLEQALRQLEATGIRLERKPHAGTVDRTPAPSSPVATSVPACPPLPRPQSAAPPSPVPQPCAVSAAFEPPVALAGTGQPVAPSPSAAGVSFASRPTPAAVTGRAGFPFGGWNLEQFMGVKLFAWIGGLALFLGAAFFVKHSFEQGWVSPALRVTAGFVAGLGLVTGGVLVRRREYTVTSHSLCGAGVVILYTSSFAAHGYYQLLSQGSAFMLMTLVTAAAFLLADRLRAVPVAVLGIVGGFLTPPLLATEVDRPLGLFGYVALLDTALVAVALRRRWHYLLLLGAVGTVMMQLGWAGKFFVVGKAVTLLTILAAFSVLFLGALVAARRLRTADAWVTGPALGMSFATFAWAGWLLTFREFGAAPGLFFSFLLLGDLCVLTVLVIESGRWVAHLGSGGLVFLLLATWTLTRLEPGWLGWGLGAYLGFALLHTFFPLLLERLRPGRGLLWPAHLFPPLALVLILGPMLRTIEVSRWIWPVVLLVNGLAVVLAVLSGAHLTVLAGLGLTAALTAAWLWQAPAELTALPEFLAVVGCFAVFFFTLGVALSQQSRMGRGGSGAGGPHPGEPAWFAALRPPSGPEALHELVPATSAALPFLLLIMAVGRLPLVDPTPIFALGLLLVLLLLGAAQGLRAPGLAPMALGCVLALEFVWHNTRLNLDAAAVTCVWYLAFTVVFIAFPFASRAGLRGSTVPGATAALAGPLHFYLVHHLVKLAWPNDLMGLLPLAFGAPMFGALAYVARSGSLDAARRLRLLAWFGGSALFFVTLVFPIQFERQWLTLGWALEGAALLWLFQRVPHPGLRAVGVVLLGVAFSRLALNPAVLDYHPRSGTPILNWFLYAYGIVTACLVAGARLLAPPHHRVLGVNAPPILYSLAAVLGFLLLNIEIADCFATGATLTFDLNASLGQNMAYSLAWGLYGFGLLTLGFGCRSAGARYGGLGLLVATLLKLFLFDLWQLGGLYRVGSLLGLAVLLIVASFAYQRFFGIIAPTGNDAPPTQESPEPSPPGPGP